ncbi:RNI-like superfamily protein [Euphorbia peplus]|nr:RNI-like superfamily protein [Euphorbia peplus]
MADVPSLVSLCLDAIKKHLLLGGDDVLLDAYEIPSHIFHNLITILPPLALRNLQAQLPYMNSDDFESIDDSPKCGRKRGRGGNFNSAWKVLFKLRWPMLIDREEPDDWQQMYWETHLQNCLDEAVGLASLPSFDGFIGEMRVSDDILKSVVSEEHVNHPIYTKLHFHFHEFGQYARCLKLQNVLCVAETCDLLRNAKLQSLTLRWIKSKEHVNGLCLLLIQNSQTLTSLKFIHSKLSSDFVNSICASLEIKDKQTYVAANFSVKSSNFLENNPVLLPPCFASFLSGSSLCSLRLCDNHVDRNFARSLFTVLINASSRISIIDLSDNNIAGWLSNFDWGVSSKSELSVETNKSLQSLRVLNIRGNNLDKDDMQSLRYALFYMPNLETLDISDNPLTSEGIRSLIPYFIEAPERCSPLMELNVENCELTCKGVTQLLDTFSTLERPPKSLSIADNGLGSSIAGALAKFLGTCRSIRELNIGGIGLGSDGFQKLRNEMLEESKLLNINISKNRGGLETANFVSKLLSLSPDLLVVNASYNLMPEESFPILCSALKIAKGNLTRLDLTGNLCEYQQHHASMLAEFQHNGKPILILPEPRTPDVPYDDDP